MAHNIEFNVKNKSYSMFSVNQIPWHGLGKIVDKALTSAEAIEAANLDFEVLKLQNYVRHKDKELISPSSFSTVRSDNSDVLGAVGKDYTVVQNKDAFTFFDEIVGEGAAIFETAGVLGRGEQVFVSAKLPKTIVLDNIDQIDQYLLLSNSHDGSRSIEVLFTPIRVVCNNTLNAALSLSKNRIKIRHTASAHDRLKEAHKLLGIHTELYTEQEYYFNMLKDRAITPEEFKTYVCNVFLTRKELSVLAKAGLKYIGELEEISTRKLNIMTSVSDYFLEGAGQKLKTAKGTMWGAYSAITGYYQNAKDYSDLDKKVRSNFYGSNYNRIHNSYTLAVDMCYDRIPILREEGVGGITFRE